MSALFDLTGKVAIVTGSTKGIGEAIVHRMAEQGAKVVVSSRKKDAVDKVAADINAKYPGHAIGVPADISKKEDLQNLVDATNKAWGKVDILVCNAAINAHYGPSKDITDEQFDRIMSVNIKSNHWLSHMVLPQMVERKDGSIIIISSIGGYRGSPIIGTYAISKAADFQLARNLAVEYGPHNIRVNCVAPSIIRTYMARALWEDPKILKQATALSPLRRIGEPDEVAGAAVFLASPCAAFITGQVIVTDGGVSIAGTGMSSD